MTLDEQMNEWLATRERIADHIKTLNPASRSHFVGDSNAKAAAAALAKLKAWQQEIDELMIDWLMPE
jgi:hypothetical protein